jgi:hypothetical protein
MLRCETSVLRRPTFSFSFVKGGRTNSKNFILTEESGVLGAFVKVRKVTISFVMSVRRSVSMEQLGSKWTDFIKVTI